MTNVDSHPGVVKKIPRKLSPMKRWFFRGLTLAIVLGAIEAMSYLTLRTMDGGYRITSMHERQFLLSTGAVSTTEMSYALHPYVGWVANPDVSRGLEVVPNQMQINRFGWFDTSGEIPKRSPDKLIIGVLGGSVAFHLTSKAKQALLNRLKTNPEFASRDIRIVTLAMSGYKQPQQLMTLSYFLTLGAEFDVIVNIDGFNEIVLPARENDPAGVFAAYPRRWNVHMLNVVNPANYNMSYRLLETRAQRQELALKMTTSFLKFSPTRNLIWLLSDRGLRHKLFDIQEDLRDRQQVSGRGFHSNGPAQFYSTEHEMYEHLVQLWVNANVQLQGLCTANKTLFVHILQPNQHFEGSKPIGPEEHAIAFGKVDYGYNIAAKAGYPKLVKAGDELLSRGVNFHDLTMLFSEVKDTIYADGCCHYNQRGNNMLAVATADLVIAAWSKRAEKMPRP